MNEYTDLKTRLARGWNTWNVRSVFSHVLLPQGLAIHLGLKEFSEGACLAEALVGREEILPGRRTWDGRYIELTLKWKGIELRLQSGTDGDDLLVLATPIALPRKTPLLLAEAGLFGNVEGALRREGSTLKLNASSHEVAVHATRKPVEDAYLASAGPCLAIPVDGPSGFCTGRRRTVEEIQTVLAAARRQCEEQSAKFGPQAELYRAMQTCLAWNTIYDAAGRRVISPVSRIWSAWNGGWMLFCWDTYFAALLASLDNKDLAYANAIEITRERTATGFVPNTSTASGFKTLDRSQPPLGSLTVLQLYRRFGDRWLLEELFDDLLAWNRWWMEHRLLSDTRGRRKMLTWGSDPYEPVVGNEWETKGVGERFGASLESGLDNTPMYDGVPFDARTHLLQMHDVGLNSLYIADCNCLSEIADVLARPEAKELRERADSFARALQSLWDEPSGLFLNRRTDTGEFSKRISPVNFYPLLAKVATREQARRMVEEHLLNAREFAGEWMLPSISRDDAAYGDQDYWRGRIWPPMNFLVYLGLLNYDLPDARRHLAEKSAALLLKEWREKGHVHENYGGDSGQGCDKPNSDPFYHWGGLLGLIALIESGHYEWRAGFGNFE